MEELPGFTESSGPRHLLWWPLQSGQPVAHSYFVLTDGCQSCCLRPIRVCTVNAALLLLWLRQRLSWNSSRRVPGKTSVNLKVGVRKWAALFFFFHDLLLQSSSTWIWKSPKLIIWIMYEKVSESLNAAVKVWESWLTRQELLCRSMRPEGNTSRGWIHEWKSCKPSGGAMETERCSTDLIIYLGEEMETEVGGGKSNVQETRWWGGTDKSMWKKEWWTMEILEKGEMEGVKECLWTRPPLYLCNLSTVLQSER